VVVTQDSHLVLTVVLSNKNPAAGGFYVLMYINTHQYVCGVRATYRPVDIA